MSIFARQSFAVGSLGRADPRSLAPGLVLTKPAADRGSRRLPASHGRTVTVFYPAAEFYSPPAVVEQCNLSWRWQSGSHSTGLGPSVSR